MMSKRMTSTREIGGLIVKQPMVAAPKTMENKGSTIYCSLDVNYCNIVAVTGDGVIAIRYSITEPLRGRSLK